MHTYEARIVPQRPTRGKRASDFLLEPPHQVLGPDFFHWMPRQCENSAPIASFPLRPPQASRRDASVRLERDPKPRELAMRSLRGPGASLPRHPTGHAQRFPYPPPRLPPHPCLLLLLFSQPPWHPAALLRRKAHPTLVQRYELKIGVFIML